MNAHSITALVLQAVQPYQIVRRPIYPHFNTNMMISWIAGIARGWENFCGMGMQLCGWGGDGENPQEWCGHGKNSRDGDSLLYYVTLLSKTVMFNTVIHNHNGLSVCSHIILFWMSKLVSYILY